MELSLNEIQKFMNQWFDQKAMNHPFIHDLRDGKVTVDQIKGFAVNWHNCTAHISLLFPLVYYRSLGFVLKHPQFRNPLIDKLVEETSYPQPGALMRKLSRFTTALGYTDSQLVSSRLIPEAFGYINFFDRVFTEGTVAEICASVLPEGLYFRRLFPVIGRGLMTHYGLNKQETEYFTDEELGSRYDATNWEMLEKLINSDAIEERPDWGVEYVAEMSIRMLEFLLTGVYKRFAAEKAAAEPTELDRVLKAE